MSYQDIADFFKDIASSKAEDLIQGWFNTQRPHVFESEADYMAFTSKIRADWPDLVSICVAGSSNWRYSLNPRKNFSEFHDRSDVDVVLIGQKYFEETWEEIRSLHRKRWYSWPDQTRQSVMRLGANIYCGFISPKYIPDRTSKYRFSFLTKCNSYSSRLVGFREVNMMFFKSRSDAVDYYVRGIRLAKRRL